VESLEPQRETTQRLRFDRLGSSWRDYVFCDSRFDSCLSAIAFLLRLSVTFLLLIEQRDLRRRSSQWNQRFSTAFAESSNPASQGIEEAWIGLRALFTKQERLARKSGNLQEVLTDRCKFNRQLNLPESWLSKALSPVSLADIKCIFAGMPLTSQIRTTRETPKPGL
jgi:hypothetical protein